jgi:hypothetical protein
MPQGSQDLYEEVSTSFLYNTLLRRTNVYQEFSIYNFYFSFS